MNILLIHPFVTARRPNIFLNEPLGLISLATYLEKKLGYNASVEILDLYALGDEIYGKPEGDFFVIGVHDEKKIRSLLINYQPDIIGICSNFTAYAKDSLKVARIAKKYLPSIPVVLGGAHASLNAEEILRNYFAVDYVVCGEGEITLTELVLYFMQKLNKNLQMIEGLVFRTNNGEIIRNHSRPLIASLEELPIPDRKFINVQRYNLIGLKSLRLTKKRPAMNIITSRGCPFQCIFCSSKVMWKRKWRANTPEMVIKEIEILVEKYGVQEIVIQDDQFITDKNRVHKICDLIIEKKINITLSVPAGVSCWIIDNDLLRKMKQAGFYRICFPIETGNQKSLRFIRKKIDLKDILKKIRFANQLGFWTQGNFIIGFPYETREDILETIKYAYNSGLDQCFFFIAKPYPGTEMYEIYKKEGLLNNTVHASHIERSDCNTIMMTSSELNALRDEAINGLFKRQFLHYLSPHTFFVALPAKLKTFNSIKYAIKMVVYIYRKNRQSDTNN